MFAESSKVQERLDVTDQSHNMQLSYPLYFSQKCGSLPAGLKICLI